MRSAPATGSTSTSYRDVMSRLGHAQKTAVGIGAYSRYVNRPIGRRITAAAYLAGATPNQVTAVSALISAAGIAAAATLPAAWWMGPLVGGLLVLGYAFDSADGQLARLRGGGSPAGEWLDHVVDIAKLATLHLAFALYLRRLDDVPDAWALVGAGYAVLAVVAFFAWLLFEQLVEVHALRSNRPRAPRRAPTPRRALLKLPLDYGVLCVVTLLLGVPTAFLAAYTLLFAVQVVYVPLALREWFGRLRSLD